MQVLFIMRLSTNGFGTVLRGKICPFALLRTYSFSNQLVIEHKFIFVSFKYSTSTDITLPIYLFPKYLFIYMLYPSKWKLVG